MRHPFLSYGRGRHAGVVPGAPALSARSVGARYAGSVEVALWDVSLRVPSGARVALVGPNGAGKSTLLKAAAGLLPVSSGEILIYGNPVGTCHHRVAYLPQRGEIDWRFPISLQRLVMTGRYVHLGWMRRPGRKDREIVARVIGDLGLAPLAERQIGQLSGGQQQRALLARALAQEADLLLLDEPLNAVDSGTRATISRVLSGLQSRGKTMIVATHDLATLASEFDGALYLREGREVRPEPGDFVGMPVGREASWAG